MSLASRLSFYRVPLCVPYWNGATYRALFGSLISGSIVAGPRISDLRSLIIESLGVEEAVLCASGRLALELALRACGIGPGDEVVIPSFCCSAVVPPILSAGAMPVLADIGADLNVDARTVERVLTGKTKGIIVPHLFGNPADIQEIVNLAEGRGIRVIDDAAQALGATIDGRPVGSFGDAGILSFGREKVCFGLGGGVLLFRANGGLKSNLNLDLQLPERMGLISNLLSSLIARRWRRWTLPVITALSLEKGSDPESSPGRYRKEGMSNLDAAVAYSLWNSLAENISRRRARVDAYRELLGKEEGIRVVAHGPGSACLTQVVQAPAKRRNHDLSARIIDTLRNAGYEVRGSFVPIHFLSDYRGLTAEPLPYTERVWSDLIELPCEPGVGLEDVERIATILKTVLRS